jgi:ribosome-binding factor A
MSRRVERINSMIKSTVSQSISQDLNDPRLSGLLTITSVETTPDLKKAKIYVSAIASDVPATEILDGLKSSSKFLKRSLEKLFLKKIPELEFVIDDSTERADRLNSILNQTRSPEMEP